jgi:precorrin-3B synthase
VTSLRRGTCPGIQEPFPTGDGWLARWTPHRSIPLEAFAGLCDVSERLGNGVLEVTQRGSIQIRGLPERCDLTAEMHALGLPVQEFPAFISAPLIGVEGGDSAFAPQTRNKLLACLAEFSGATKLDRKLSVLLDDESALHLDHVRADLRFRCSDQRVHLALGGDAVTATSLGWLLIDGVTPVLMRLLGLLSVSGATRGRDLISDLRAVQIELAPWLSPGAPPASRPLPERIGLHALTDGSVVRGLGLAFGFSAAANLRQLSHEAARLGAHSLRPAPDRTIQIVGLPEKADPTLLATAAVLNFITLPADPRRYVIACAGAPVCSSACLATRALAPRIAEAAQHLLSTGTPIHLSGCSKGCALPRAAPLTFAGPDALILDGAADAPPARRASVEELITQLRELDQSRAVRAGAEANPYRALLRSRSLQSAQMER